MPHLMRHEVVHARLQGKETVHRQAELLQRGGPAMWLYNQQLPQSALGSKTPLQAMKDWHKLKPELFKKQPYYRPGCDI